MIFLLLYSCPRRLPHADPFGLVDKENEEDDDTEEDIPSPFESSDEEAEKEDEMTVRVKYTEKVEINPQPFVLAYSLSRQASQCVSSLDFFRLFVTSGMINIIVEATNKYGASLFGENWTSTITAEINRLFAAVICMGISRLPTIDSYWHHDLRVPFVTQIFPQRARFRRLCRSFYLNTGDRNPADPLWHVRLLISHFETSFPSHYSPSHVLVVDESMVPCKARSNLKQYMKKKPHKWGYKIWCLASDGYIVSYVSKYTLADVVEIPLELHRRSLKSSLLLIVDIIIWSS